MEDRNGSNGRRGGGFGLVLFISRAFAVSVEVFLHEGFGREYIGPQGAAVIPLLLVFGCFWPGYDLSSLVAFGCMFLLCCLAARVEGLRHREERDRRHSRYSGRPRLMRRFRRVSERALKSRVEPAIVALLGAILCPISLPMGAYIIIAGACMGVNVNLAIEEERQRTTAMNDALIEQQIISESVRSLRARRW